MGGRARADGSGASLNQRSRSRFPAANALGLNDTKKCSLFLSGNAGKPPVTEAVQDRVMRRNCARAVFAIPGL